MNYKQELDDYITGSKDPNAPFNRSEAEEEEEYNTSNMIKRRTMEKLNKQQKDYLIKKVREVAQAKINVVETTNVPFQLMYNTEGAFIKIVFQRIMLDEKKAMEFLLNSAANGKTRLSIIDFFDEKSVQKLKEELVENYKKWEVEKDKVVDKIIKYKDGLIQKILFENGSTLIKLLEQFEKEIFEVNVKAQQ